MLTEEHFADLDKKGYTVVKDVITAEQCDAAIAQYKEWLAQFKDGFPKSFNTIINRYNTGHLPVTWDLRLRSKKVFSQLWKTEKLLTSFDAIGIGRPPEEGKEDFQDVRRYWLHTDQIATRVGLHAYQGALYLEEQCKDDWTFQVMEGSHKLLEHFYDLYPDSAKFSEPLGYCSLGVEEVDFFRKANCRVARVPVPKGGMALWDSRLIHANARPIINRKHPGRWRYVVFVSMTPAIWASEDDLKAHKQAYEEALMTSHWSSQGLQPHGSHGPRNIICPTEVPEIAKTEEAKKLSGAVPYDFEDGLPNGGDYRPRSTTATALKLTGENVGYLLPDEKWFSLPKPPPS